jgi:uncharacterized protein
MSEITITRMDNPNGGRYVARVAGMADLAELVFARRSKTLIVAEHTFAPDALRGTGVAKALVDRMIADARAEGFKIVPQCPYVLAQYRRHPEWSDVIEG